MTQISKKRTLTMPMRKKARARRNQKQQKLRQTLKLQKRKKMPDLQIRKLNMSTVTSRSKSLRLSAIRPQFLMKPSSL